MLSYKPRLSQLATDHAHFCSLLTCRSVFAPSPTRLPRHMISGTIAIRYYSSNIRPKNSDPSIHVHRGPQTGTKKRWSAAAFSVDPYSYTRGRWLLNDAAEQRARQLTFDFDALCTMVLKHCSGAKCIDHVEKKEGSYSRAFVFSLDNGEKLVARIPTSAAGPAGLVTSSEVATIIFLQRTTKIPIPQIVEWSDNTANDIGSEFILMKHAEGIELRKIWFSLDIGVQISCIYEIMKQVEETTRLSFPAYGSLYFQNATALLAHDHIPIDNEFCIGPHCGRMYWDCTPGEQRYYDRVPKDRGPWQGLQAYVFSLINAGLSRLPSNSGEGGNDHSTRPFQGSPAEHRELLRATHKLLQAIIGLRCIQENAMPTLLHPDLHMSNIFVDPNEPTRITGIIDWQSASIEPAFLTLLPVLEFAIPPQYLSQYKEREADGKATERQYWDATLDVCIQANGRLAPLREMDDDILKHFYLCHRTWSDGLPVAARELNVLLDRWGALGLPGDPPCDATARDRLRTFAKNYESYKDAKRLKEALERKLDAGNGWVTIDQWEQAQELHELAYKRTVEIIQEPDSDTTLDYIKAIWPYDLPC